MWLNKLLKDLGSKINRDLTGVRSFQSIILAMLFITTNPLLSQSQDQNTLIRGYWVGPYRILSKVSDRNYVLKIGGSSVTVIIDRIKPYRGVFNEKDKTNVGKTDKSSGNVEYCVGSDNDSDNTDSDSDETCWLFAEALIERVELPDLDQDQHGDVDANSVTEFHESSEIEL